MNQALNFLGYSITKLELHPIENINKLGETQYGLVIIEHPNGFFSKEYNTKIIWVRPEDLMKI